MTTVTWLSRYFDGRSGRTGLYDVICKVTILQLHGLCGKEVITVRTRPSKTYLKTNSIYTCLPSIRYDTIRAIITGDSQDRYILYVTFQFLLVCVSNQRCPINCLHLIITLRHSANQVDGRHNYSSRKAKAGYVDDIRRVARDIISVHNSRSP